MIRDAIAFGAHDRRAVLKLSAAASLGVAATLMPETSRAAEAGPWQLLFNGVSLDGWDFWQDGVGDRDRDHVVTIDDGMIRFHGSGFTGAAAGPGYLVTQQAYANYHMRLDYRWGLARYAPRALQGRNSGLLYHMQTRTGDQLFPPSVEFQIQEGNAGDAVLIDTLGLQGPSLGGTPLWPQWLPSFAETYAEPVRAGGYARLRFQKHFDFERLDTWNTLDLYVVGDRAAQLVNGRIVNTLFKLRRPAADGSLALLDSGRIGLEFEWAEIAWRNIMLRNLPEDYFG